MIFWAMPLAFSVINSGSTVPSSPKAITLVLSANADYHNLVVHSHVPKLKAGKFKLQLANRAVNTQQVNRGNGVDLTWIVDDMKKGDVVRYRLLPVVTTAKSSNRVVVTSNSKKDVVIEVDGKPFATYDNHTGPNKPYFFPMYTSTGKLILRHYGVETVPGETHDHPHHRGLWFTHGDVNGQDFWSEDPKAAKTVTTNVIPNSGTVSGTFIAHTDWIANNGNKIATDERKVTIYAVTDGRLLDFEVEISPVGGPLVFGDTKEGSFGMRLPDTMRNVGGDGHINSDTGVQDAKTWGKKAAWVDYFGTVEGETIGVAIFDSTGNLRHPTTWHVRDYGLFAVNPFGLHDFENDKANPKKGNFTVEVGKYLTLKYRVFIHKGSTMESHITETWNSFSIPPAIVIE